MKGKIILSGIALCTALFFIGCSDDDKPKKEDTDKISGTWDIIDAVGVEWEEDEGNTGAGTIINTNDPDTDMIGETFVIEETEITLFGDTYPFEFSDGEITIDFGGGDTESFNVVFMGTKTMIWSQDEPTAHADYDEKDGGQFLYYQKTFTLERN